MIHPIAICLWFENQAEEAARFYISIFRNSKIKNISYYGKEGFEFHGREKGSVMTVGFTIDDQPFIALNGGPVFKFNESISLQVFCRTQDEIDYYWNRLTEGGAEGQCGWLKDKYGLSWQIIPDSLSELMSDPARAERVTRAFLQMKKFNIAALQKA
ncbi:MAG: VOC family protein [Bacteroidales bacterium]|jgi:predicted 3-demethylubiquinone-9 3-methyltransferase (glyoxalase superfamily)